MNSQIKLTLEKNKIKMLGEMNQDLQDVSNAIEIKEGKFKVEFV